MEVVEFEDPEAFQSFTGPLLLRSEARHSLMLGVIGTLISRPDVYPEYRLWAVSDGRRALAAAIRTPPHNVLLADTPNPESLGPLARSLLDEVDAPGFQSPEPTGRRFASAWESVTGVEPEMTMQQGVYALSEVEYGASTSGAWRRCTEDDLELGVEWITAFLLEADPDPILERLEEGLRRRLRADPQVSALWVWEDAGEPVSMSGYGNPTHNGIRIGPVYTPPGERNRGYASSLVAAQSQWLLDQGRSFCFLHTDMANPTANSIYQRIGYRKVCDSSRYTFSSATE